MYIKNNPETKTLKSEKKRDSRPPERRFCGENRKSNHTPVTENPKDFNFIDFRVPKTNRNEKISTTKIKTDNKKGRKRGMICTGRDGFSNNPEWMDSP